MALVGHWPFDGVLEDYSGNRNKPDGVSYSWDNNGKIGKAVNFNGSSSYLYAKNPVKLLSNFTICFWMKPGSETKSWTDVFTFNNTSYFRFERENVETTYGVYAYSCTESENKKVGVSMVSGIQIGKWQHITLTVSGNTIEAYLNGVLKKSATITFTPYFTNTDRVYFGNRGDGGMCWKGALNDFRIYDEVLSLKEIREIAKAKVMHFPLNNQSEGIVCNKFSTTKPSTGVNHGQDNGIVTDIAPPIKGYPVYKVSDDGVDGQCCRYPVLFDADSLSLWDRNVCISMYVFVPDEFKSRITGSTIDIFQNSTGVDWHNTAGYNSTYNFYAAGDITKSKVYYDVSRGGMWQRMSVVARADSSKRKVTSDNNDSENNKYIAGYFRINFSGATNGGTPYYLYLSCPQIEYGSQPGPYLGPSSFKNVGFGDASGFRHHGKSTLTSCPEWSSDSVDGSGSFDFSQHTIKFEHPFTTASEITVSGWIKKSATNTTGNHLISLGDNHFLRIALDKGAGIWVYMNYGSEYITATYGTTADFPIGTWIHVSVTFKDGIIKFYKNGALVKTFDASATCTTLVSSDSRSYIGSFGGHTELTKGKLSDLRVYATALSDTDIKALYDEKASLAKNGKMITGEFIEEVSQSNNVTSTTVKITARGWPQRSTVTFNGTTYSGSRSWNVLVIDSKFNYVGNYTYDVYAGGTKPGEFINKIESIPYGYYCIIYTSDCPSTNATAVLNYLQEYSPTIKQNAWSGRDAYFLVIRKGHYGRVIAEKFVKSTGSETTGANTNEMTVTLTKNKNSITKKSQFITDEIDEVSTIYDMPIKYQYGALWARIYYNSKSNLWTTAEVSSCNTADKISYLGKLEEFRGPDNKFEFMLQYSYTSKYNRWRQSSNPMTSTSVSEYFAIHIDSPGSTDQSFVGLRKYDNKNTYIAGCKGSNWYYAIGPKSLWSDVIPALYEDSGVTVGTNNKQELWVRIDNVPRIFKMYKNGSSKAREYIEQ